MISMRVAETKKDLQSIYALTRNATEQERKFLRINGHDPIVEDRIHTNVLKGSVTVFLVDDVVVGFIEYSIRPNYGVWIYSLYILPEYRRYTQRFVPVAFNSIKKLIRKDIHFTVHKDNDAMNLLCRYIKAEPIKTYGDGRIEWSVPWKKRRNQSG